MRKSMIFPILLFLAASLSSSEKAPTLVFDGVNGYPSSGDSAYKIEIFVGEKGLISEIKSHIDNSSEVYESTAVSAEKNGIRGERRSRGSRTVFEFSVSGNEIIRHIVVYDNTSNSVFRDESSVVRIAPRPGVLFETDTRRFSRSIGKDFQIFEKASNEHLYSFIKNQIINEGWYRSDWKTKGRKTSVREYQTMEKYAEWIDAGHGVFTGDSFANENMNINTLNFCILDVVYPNNPIFIPFIFGLKTGTY